MFFVNLFVTQETSFPKYLVFQYILPKERGGKKSHYVQCLRVRMQKYIFHYSDFHQFVFIFSCVENFAVFTDYKGNKTLCCKLYIDNSMHYYAFCNNEFSIVVILSFSGSWNFPCQHYFTAMVWTHHNMEEGV